ncbi:MAG: hypothetical protein OXG72_07800 [Acidobacteria bacterium]|nr:hypothetical protein [Acidobacteriota bacterium]
MRERNWTVARWPNVGTYPTAWDLLGSAGPDGVFSDCWMTEHDATVVAGVLRLTTDDTWRPISTTELGL